MSLKAPTLALLSLLWLVGAPALGATQPSSAADSDWETAVAAAREGRFEDAAAAARRVVATHPDHPGGHSLLGSSLLSLGRTEEALASLEEAHRLAPNEPSHALTLARARLKSGRLEGAVELLEALLAGLANGGDLGTERRTALALLTARAAQSDPSRASRIVERGAALLPEQAVLWLALAEVHRTAGRMAEAYSALLRAQRLDPQARQAGEAAVYLARRETSEAGDPDAKRTWSRRAAEAADLLLGSPPRLSDLRSSAESWLAADEPVKAAERLRTALELFGEDAALRYQLARCALDREDWAAAESELEAALAGRPDADLRARIHRALATLYHRRGDYAEAAAAYRKAGMSAQADALTELADTRRECLDLRARIEGMLEVSEAPDGSSERRALERELEAIRVTCADVLEPAVL